MSGDERVRLFVALELPEVVREVLVDWRSESLRAGSGLRPVAPEYLHVTLCFLGWQEAHEVDGITAACAAAALEPGSPAELETGSATWLPPRRPRVLAIDLTDAQGHLAALQRGLSTELERGGFYQREKRPFRPHITVARVGRGARPGQLPPVRPVRFAAGRFTLYRSRLSPAGARYDALARFE